MKSNALSLICSGIMLFSCSSTHIVNSWKDPDTHVSSGEWKKILVVGLLKDEANRRIVEDEMATLLKGRGVQSYAYFKNTVEHEKLAEQLKNDGFDAAITMRLVDVDKEVTYTPGTISSYPVYYRTLSGYYIQSWEYYTTPGRHQSTTSYSVETNVYLTGPNKLVWSGLTETVEPTKVENMISEIANAVFDEMVRENFISE